MIKRLSMLALALCLTAAGALALFDGKESAPPAGPVLLAAQAAEAAAPLLAEQPPFPDVSEGDWYYDEVAYVSAHGLMNGFSDGTFSPALGVTRAMAVTVLYRQANFPQMEGKTSFPDVTPDAWYYQAVAWAQSVGIANGYETGAFGPNDLVSREQLAVFLLRYAQHQGGDIAQGVLGGYQDAPQISGWALDGFKHAVGTGLISGTEGNLLDPKGTTTRAQLAVILTRMDVPVSG